jgi:hypothetical protein
MFEDLSTYGLIESIKLDGLIPDGMFEDDDYIKFINDAYFHEVIPFIMRHREDFYVGYQDFSPAASIDIPSDAIAQKIKDVQVKKDENTFYNLPRLSMGEITAGKSTWNKPDGFYIQGNQIIFYPRAQSNTIRLVYYKRPISLINADVTITETDVVRNETVFRVTGKTSGTILVVSPNPAANYPLGSYDFNRVSISSPYEVTGITGLIASGGGQFTTTSTIYSATNIGDYLVPPGFSVIPQIPYEARDVLSQAAIVKAMIAMKDKDGYKIAKESLNEAKFTLSSLISPRIDNEVKKIVNTSSPLWGGKKGWR